MTASWTDILVLGAGYGLAVFGGGWLVGFLLTKAGMGTRLSPVGKCIGWFERFLIITLALAGELSAIGFVMAAKSILRFSESREDRKFAEYVLLGTLISVSIAVTAGLLMRHVTQKPWP